MKTGLASLIARAVVIVLLSIPATIGAARTAGAGYDATVTGSIVSAATGAPVGGAKVECWEWQTSSYRLVKTVTASSSGAYSFGNLWRGRQHKFRAYDAAGVYRPEFFGGQEHLEDATPVSPPRAGTNIYLDRLNAAGRITGTVKAAGTGLPLAGVLVSAETLPNAIVVTSTVTAADGTYSLAAVPGRYVVGFQLGRRAGVYYPNVPYDPAMGAHLLAQALTVSDMKTTSGINAALVGYGAATVGTDFLPGGNSAVELYRVDPVSGQLILSGTDYLSSPHRGVSLRPLYPDLIPGTYTARLTNQARNYASTYLGGSPFPSAAATFVVSEFATTSVDFTPQLGGVATGTVTPGNPAYAGGYDPVWIVALAQNPATGRWEHVAGVKSSGADSTFDLGGLPRLPVRIGILGDHDGWGEFGGWGYVGGSPRIANSPDVVWFDDTEPSRTATGGIELDALGMGGAYGHIAGTVAKSSTYAIDYYVQPYSLDASGTWSPVGVPSRFAGASYRVDLPLGSYKLGFFMHGAEPVYNGGAFSLGDAPVIDVSSGGVEGVNAPLLTGYRCDFPAPDVDVVYNAKATVRLAATASSGRPAGGASFVLQSSTDGKSWTTVKSVVADASGRVTTSVTPPARTVYYRLWNSQTYYTTKKSQAVRKRAVLSTPYSSSRVRRATTFGASGYVGPKHSAGSRAVRLQCYRLESGVWRLRKTVYATCSARTATSSSYRASVSLPSTGRWRIRAYHGADSVHVGTYSGYRYITVN